MNVYRRFFCCEGGVNPLDKATAAPLSFMGELEVTERTPCARIRSMVFPLPLDVTHAPRNYQASKRMRKKFEAEVGFSIRTVKVRDSIN